VSLSPLCPPGKRLSPTGVSVTAVSVAGEPLADCSAAMALAAADEPDETRLADTSAADGGGAAVGAAGVDVAVGVGLGLPRVGQVLSCLNVVGGCSVFG
jgi:hypothetical protein